MLFREWYGAYYNTMAELLSIAVKRPLRPGEMQKIVEKNAFAESMISIPQAIKNEDWQLLYRDGTTPIKQEPSIPLTTLQKQWINAVALDPRMKLFGEEIATYPEAEPLFLPGDYYVFDRYGDGDDYEDEKYIAHFRLILDAIRNKYPLMIRTKNRRGELITNLIRPKYLEYSEKDDKFRVVGAGGRFGSTINLSRILHCMAYEDTYHRITGKMNLSKPKKVVLELTDQRHALERVLFHFAHFQKEAERLEKDKYRITVFYDSEDETELVIRILSFGPLVKVMAPSQFVNLIKERLQKQQRVQRF